MCICIVPLTLFLSIKMISSLNHFTFICNATLNNTPKAPVNGNGHLLWWLALTVNLTESGIPFQMGLWSYLLGVILITLVELGECSYDSCHHALAGVLDRINKQMEVTINTASIFLCSQRAQRPSSLKLSLSPVPCGKAQRNPFSFRLLCQKQEKKLNYLWVSFSSLA